MVVEDNEVNIIEDTSIIASSPITTTTKTKADDITAEIKEQLVTEGLQEKLVTVGLKDKLSAAAQEAAAIMETHNLVTSHQDDECKEEGEYMLRWSEHNSQLIHVFYQLCQAEEFCDVTIATENQQFKAHKLILSACSPYFRQLFLANPCKHPVVFIKDISDHHMALLLEYMYRGSIAVKQFELEDILSAASVLKIRGLTTATLPPDHLAPVLGGKRGNYSLHEDDIRQHPTSSSSSSEEEDEAPLIVDESAGNADKYHHVETSSSISGKSGSRKPEGRKSSVPKKLRLSGGLMMDHDEISSTHHLNSSGSPLPLTSTVGLSSWSFLQQAAAISTTSAHNKSAAETSMEHLSTSPLLGGAVTVLSGSSIGDNRSPDTHTLTSDTEEIDTDQPVDFSTTNNSKINMAPRYSILGSYLKSGIPVGLDDQQRRNELAEDLRRAGYGTAAPWLTGLEQLTGLKGGLNRPASRDSRGDSREERNSSGEDYEKDSKKGSPTPPPQPLGAGSLTDSLGIDIAGRLRSHFLANLPSQSYAWLNGMSNGNISSLNSLASMSQLGAIGSLPGLGSLASLSPGSGKDSGASRQRRGSTEKMEKHPIGGVRTGEIGANGKPAVACEVCGKKLADPSSLYRHRKIHSGDKPHKCPYCPRRFIQRYNMKQHIKTHRIELMADQTSLPEQNFMEQENHNITA